MANLIPVGMPVKGHTRRFAKIPQGRFIYTCPRCTGLVSNDEAWCICDQDLCPVASLYWEVPTDG